MVAEPGDYRWSSYQERMGQRVGLLAEDPCYEALACDDEQRWDRYRLFVSQGIPELELQLIREAVQRGQLTGDNRFVDQVEQIIGRRVEKRGPGRPAAGK